MKELEKNIDDMIWREHKETGLGIKSKLIRAKNGKKTILFKMPEGFVMGVHTHTKTEQHFVLQGKYEIGGKIYIPGTYNFISAGTIHGPLTSKSETIILIIR